jgi:DNA ligase (NAD+)
MSELLTITSKAKVSKTSKTAKAKAEAEAEITISKTSKPKISKAKTSKTKTAKTKSISSIDSDILDQINNDPYSFVSDTDAETLESIISYAAERYYNDVAVISDETYDFLIDTIKEIDPDNPVLKQVGAKVMSKNKVKLPYYMGSMDKVKPSDQAVLNKWKSKFKGPYVHSDKLDGVSGLLVLENSKLKLFTRGDGYEGTDISNLINYISTIPKLNLSTMAKSSQPSQPSQPSLTNLSKLKSFAVRGELIMSIKNFEKYADRMANARNMVSGIVNSKTIDIDVVPDVEFVAYEIIQPWYQSQSEQFNILKQLGFKVVSNSKIGNTKIDDSTELDDTELDDTELETTELETTELDTTELDTTELETTETETNTGLIFSDLTKILKQRKVLSEYEIDGIIISNDSLPAKRKADTNPEYAFAFKDPSLLASAEVKVLGVEWSISKDGYIKPTLKLVPTQLSGVKISSVTAINAKYVLDNVLGPGAIIELIRSGDVIPKIQKVLKPATSGEAHFPDPDIEYEWTATNVDIITISGSDEQQEKELTFFFKKLSIPNVDESTVRKMIKVGIDSIPKILIITKEELAEIDGFKERMVEKIYDNITNRIRDLTMLDLMTASNVFGHGLGERKLRKIMETYPDIIELYSNNSSDEIIEMIRQIDGFDTKTAEYFSTGLEKFINLFNMLEAKMRKKLRISISKFKEELEQKAELINNTTNRFANKTIVFSGFRNKEWESIIASKGGKIGSSISSKTSILVTNQEDIDKGTNGKVKTAIELGIPIMSKEKFVDEYGTELNL